MKIWLKIFLLYIKYSQSLNEIINNIIYENFCSVLIHIQNWFLIYVLIWFQFPIRWARDHRFRYATRKVNSVAVFVLVMYQTIILSCLFSRKLKLRHWKLQVHLVWRYWNLIRRNYSSKFWLQYPFIWIL